MYGRTWSLGIVCRAITCLTLAALMRRVVAAHLDAPPNAGCLGAMANDAESGTTHETTKLPRPYGIVIACDREPVRTGLRSMLRDESDLVIVGEAENGWQAQTLCRELSPAVVLLDLQAQRHVGIDVAQAIPERFPGVRLILIAMREKIDDLLHVIPAGAAVYLLRSATRQQLVSTIRLTISGALPAEAHVIVQLRQRAENAAVDRVEPGLRHLSSRETEVLQLVTEGYINREIALALSLSVGTVKIHVEHILAKLGVSDRTQAAVRAVELKAAATKAMETVFRP